MEFILEFFQNIWKYLAMSGPYLLLGLFVSGLIKSLLPDRFIEKSLGKKNVWAVLKASLLGVPLPLCSCSVIPTAITLKKSGASRASTSAFLISTPESGIDSMLMTYGMMDLPMTLIRPIGAFISAFFTGLMQILFGKEDEIIEKPKVVEEKKYCCSQHQTMTSPARRFSIKDQLKKTLSYAFGDLINDIAFWMLIGILLGALLDTVVPASYFESLNGWSGKFLMLLIGIPMYICASASTPLAASAIIKGMSPGTAIVFLMVGPATNIANLLVLRPYLGKRGLTIHLLGVSFSAIILGVLVDWAYATFKWPLIFQIGNHHEHLGIFSQICGAIILCLLLKGIYQQKIKK